MVKEGLFDRFPMEMVFGMHNWPRCRPAPSLGATARHGGGRQHRDHHHRQGRARRHAASGHRPDRDRQPIVAALQTIVARNVDPVESGVVTIGQIKGGHTLT